MNVHLIRLSGTPHSIGETHGKAAKDAEALGALMFFGEFLEHLVKFPVRGRNAQRLRKWLYPLVESTAERRLIEQIPNRYREMADGFSSSSGLPLPLIEKAYVMPDLFSYFLGRSRDSFFSHILKGFGLGCTSFAVTPSQGNSSTILHGRNLDYPGGDRFGNHPAIIEYHPVDGQKYCAATALGIDGPGISGMNESGITLALHMNYSKRVTLSSTPVVVIGHEIIRQATSLKEAVEIARQYEIGSGWSFVLTSARENNAVVLEEDSKDFELRGLVDRHLICTNHYVSESLRKHETWHSPGKEMDSNARMNRVKRFLTPEKIERFGFLDAMELLSDSEDDLLGKEKGFVNTVCAADTLLSVVFDAGKQVVCLAQGPCPVSKNAFGVFSVFPGPFWKETIAPKKKPEELQKDRARREYVQASQAYFPAHDLPRVERHLKKAIDQDPEDDLYWGCLGVIQLKTGQLKEARSSLEMALQKPLTPYRAAHHQLFLGRALDLLGERNEAREAYKSVENSGSFRREALLGARKTWKRKYNSKVFLDFTLGEGILS